MTTNKIVASTVRGFLLRLALAAGLVLFSVLVVRAGGPKHIAGTVYFDPTVTGRPLTWTSGTVTYYTDQGDLSPTLPNASANTVVASAFSQWASIPTVAMQAARGGQLTEDVNRTNVILNADGTISMPVDIQSTATDTPIGIVYDYDGSVTDALLGSGASGQCLSNSVFGGSDNYGSLATYQHALIVINGLCAQQSSQLPDLQYRLLRVIGSVLGLGWSQANMNVLTGNPHPTADDYAGFPLMHFIDPLNCVPITLCYPNASHFSADDAAALARLYPVTSQNQSNFPGKQLFAASTARIHGSIWFTDTHGNRTQPMQGVNVVARWIDPTTHLPSRRYVVTSVSGFLFSGNEGNPITGTDDALGDSFDEWGSDDQSLRGYFDLSGLPLPNAGTVQYQLSVEPLDPQWSAGVGPYSPGPVSPSGSFPAITVTVSPGGDVQQDILMRSPAQPLPHASSSWTSPARIPSGGDWISSLNNYDEVDYFSIPAQAKRTLSIAVTSLDESGSPTLYKAQPVIGMWAASDPPGTSPPAYTPSPFNQSAAAMTRLDAQVLTSSNFIIGISDVRGDGRPDYRYHARVLYGNSVTPSRVAATGAAVMIHGMGFAPGLTVTIGGRAATQLFVDSTQMVLAAPASSDGLQSIVIGDPVSGASTTMTDALLYGASASDNLVLLSALSISSSVGTPSANPVTIRVIAADGTTSIPGASVAWNASNSAQLSACSGSSSCTVTTDEAGYARTWVTPTAPGAASITATLAPGVYSPAKSVSVTLTATQTSSDIGALNPYLWISQGATASILLTVRTVSNGMALTNAQVSFNVESGSGTGTMSASSAQSDGNGYAGVTLTVRNISDLVRISACIAPAMTRCAMFYANPISMAQQRLQAVTGAGQISTGQPFQPVVVRITDSSSPPNPVLAAPIMFQTTVLRPGGDPSSGGDGETNSGNPASPVILYAAQSATTTDMNGLASIVPTSAGFNPPLEVEIRATGANSVLDFPLKLLPAPNGNSTQLPGTINTPSRILRSRGTRD